MNRIRTPRSALRAHRLISRFFGGHGKNVNRIRQLIWTSCAP